MGYFSISDLEQLSGERALDDELVAVLSDALLGAPPVELKEAKKPALAAKPGLVAKPLSSPVKPGLAPAKKPQAQPAQE